MSRRVHRLAFAAATLAAALLGACAKPKPVSLGADQALAPHLAVIDSERPPRTFVITLGEKAHVAVLGVFPGRGASLLYPRDTTVASVALPQGTTTLRVDTMRVPGLPDSAFMRPMDMRRVVDSAARARERDRTRAGAADRGELERMSGLAMMGPERANLLLFASREPIDYRVLARRIAGVSIPIDPNEALSTVAKMARNATTADRWAATAIEADIRR